MSRFRAKRSSRCCELYRNVGLRDIGESRHRGLERNAVRGVASCREMRGCAAAVLVATGLGVSTPFFYCVSRSAFGPWLLTPHGAWLSRVQAAIALAMPGLALPGAGSNFSRRIGLGFPGMRRIRHSRPSPGGWRRMWRACAQEVCKPDNSRRAGHAKVANARRCRTNAISAAIILQV